MVKYTIISKLQNCFCKGENDFPLMLIAAAFGGGAITINIIISLVSYRIVSYRIVHLILIITRCSFPCSPDPGCDVFDEVEEKIQLQKDSKGLHKI